MNGDRSPFGLGWSDDIDRDTLARCSTRTPGPKYDFMKTVRQASNGTPLRLPSVYTASAYLHQRTDCSASFEEIVKIMDEVSEIKTVYGIKDSDKAPPGDSAINDAVISAITGPLSALQAWLFDAVVDSFSTSDDQKFVKPLKDAIWIVIDQLLSEFTAKTVAALVTAIKSKSPTDALKVLSVGVENLQKSLKDMNSITRRVLKIMRSKGTVFDKKMESKFREYLLKLSKKIAKPIGAIFKLLEAPFVLVATLLLTPSNVVDDKGEIYESFKLIERRLARKAAIFVNKAEHEHRFKLPRVLLGRDLNQKGTFISARP